MEITNKVDTALSETGLPFYYGMPDFGENEEPESFLTYEDTDQPELFTEGEETQMQYNITINIIIPKDKLGMVKKIKNTMKKHGFTYIGGGKLGENATFPYKIWRYMEFVINQEE